MTRALCDESLPTPDQAQPKTISFKRFFRCIAATNHKCLSDLSGSSEIQVGKLPSRPDISRKFAPGRIMILGARRRRGFARFARRTTCALDSACAPSTRLASETRARWNGTAPTTKSENPKILRSGDGRPKSTLFDQRKFVVGDRRNAPGRERQKVLLHNVDGVFYAVACVSCAAEATNTRSRMCGH